MPDFDIEKIAKAIEDMPNLDMERGSEESESEENSGPSFFPDVMKKPSEDVPTISKNKKSMLDTSSAIAVVAMLKKELHKIGCTLKDYRIEFTLNGVDINNITVGTPNIEELRKKIDKLPDDDKARLSDKVTAMALVAINDPLKKRIKDEMGMDIKFFEYEKADIGAASLGVAPEEPEEPPMPPMLPPMAAPALTPEAPAPEGAAAELGAGELPPPPPEEGGEMAVEPELEGAPDVGAVDITGPAAEGGEPEMPPPPPPAI